MYGVRECSNFILLEEKDKFLGRYKLPRVNQEEQKMNVTRPVTSTEIETVIKTLPTNKSPVTDGLTGKVYQTLRKALAPTLLKLSQKTAEEGTRPNSFSEASITLIPKADKDTTNTHTHKDRLMSLMNIDTNILNKILANQLR